VIELACPTTGQRLRPAPTELVAELQQLQRDRGLRNAAGNLVDEGFDAGWLTIDGARFYARRGAVSDLRPDAAIVRTPPVGA
jgi:hypothetical protein